MACGHHDPQLKAAIDSLLRGPLDLVRGCRPVEEMRTNDEIRLVPGQGSPSPDHRWLMHDWHPPNFATSRRLLKRGEDMPINGRPVIAVFGGSTRRKGEHPELKAARLLGQQINLAGGVVLTGATPPIDGYKGTRRVKDAAVEGAEQAAAPSVPVRWIGVANEADAAGPRWNRARTGVVVTPGGRHRRNLVEALICDAAIAIECTSAGTASETLFSLFVGRPVVAVAQDPDGTNVSPSRLAELASQKVEGGDTRRAIDRGIEAAYEWAKVADEKPRLCTLPADDKDARAVVELVLQHKPDPAVLVDEAAWTVSDWDTFVRDGLESARGNTS